MQWSCVCGENLGGHAELEPADSLHDTEEPLAWQSDGYPLGAAVQERADQERKQRPPPGVSINKTRS